MKNILVLSLLLILFAGCQQPTKPVTPPTDTTTQEKVVPPTEKETLSQDSDEMKKESDEEEENESAEEEAKEKALEEEMAKMPTTTSTATKAITLEEVKKHSTEADCWAAINGKVYDLTAWIDKHPGGDRNILRICGMDGTKAFEGKHGGEAKPEKILEGFAIGTLE
jgi:cytochrome b involved in lipid metabolism